MSDAQIGLLQQYVDHLLEWNRKVNLVSRQDQELIWQNHILHSVSILFRLKLHHPASIMDLGTGGGLPGIPLKILLPDSNFLLVDSTRKKVIAVQEMLKGLNLQGIEAVWGRVEELTNQENLLSRFDYIVARAVAPLGHLVSWSRPFFRHSSITLQTAEEDRVSPPALIAMKGGDLDEEITEARRKGMPGRVEVLDLVFPGSEEISSSGKKIVVVRF